MKRLAHDLCAANALLLTTALTACASTRGNAPTVPVGVQVEEWDYVADDGVRQYVTEFGHGDTVVVLHGGWGGEHSGLLDAVRPLADRFHFVLYDQRGSLRSPAPDSTISLPRLVRDLEGLRRQLGQERLTLFGHSMGTVLGYAYLAQYPDRVQGLLLAAALLPTNDQFRVLGVPASDTARLGRLRRELSAAQEARRTATLAAEGLDHADSARLTDRERAARWRIRLASVMLARAERWRELRGGPSFYSPGVGQAIDRNSTPAERDSLWARFLPALTRFRGPVTVVVGDADFVDPQAALWRYAAARLPRTRLVVLPGAGHLPWIDDPVRFGALVSEALTRATTR
jgi:pimeloyl-ACP methyl ester carboxylesterase